MCPADSISDLSFHDRTVVIRRDYLHYIKKYNRYEKRHKNLSAHVSPALTVKEGDMVVVGQCRSVTVNPPFALS